MGVFLLFSPVPALSFGAFSILRPGIRMLLRLFLAGLNLKRVVWGRERPCSARPLNNFIPWLVRPLSSLPGASGSRFSSDPLLARPFFPFWTLDSPPKPQGAWQPTPSASFWNNCDLDRSSSLSPCTSRSSPTTAGVPQCLVWKPALHIIIIAMAAARGTFAFSPAQPETGYDSYSSDPSSSIHTHTHHHTPRPQTDAQDFTRPRNPSVSVRSRAETLSSNTSSTSSSSSQVRRKPLPVTASPLATRFSSGEHLAATLQLPAQPFVRPYSVDSPTLHEFPPTPRLPSSPAVQTQQSFSRYIASSS